MSDINSVYSSTSRITGLYSQLDTDQIVKDLLKVQQNKVDSRDQEKTTKEWYYDALGSVKDLVKEFKDTYLSTQGEKSMLSSAAYKSYSAEMSETSAVSVATSSNALTGSYTIDSITQLAQNASVSSAGRISKDGTSISEYNSAKLQDLDFATKLVFDGQDQISFKINDISFTFDEETTLQTMINTVNADKDAGVTMKYSRLTDGFTVTADEGGADSSVKIENVSGNAFGSGGAFGIAEGTAGDEFAAVAFSLGPIASSADGLTRYSTLGELDTAVSGELFDGGTDISFDINGEVFTFDGSTSILDMMYAVNSSAAGVTMSFDSDAIAFAITSDETGEDAEVTITNISGNAFGTSGAFGIDECTVQGSVYGETGQDAVCSIEGVSVTRDSNDFTIDGITYALKQTTSEAVDFTVSRDYSATVDAVKDFIDAYNELAEKLGALTDEKVYGDYKPLTAEQEDELSETQIEKWNEKAKSGLMRNNDELEAFLRNIKSAFFSSLGGTEETMASIGITSASYFSEDAGKLLVDEKKLMAALDENPEMVISMFTEADDDSKGLVYRIFDEVNSYLDVIEENEETTTKQIGKLDKKIEEMEDDLEAMADRYYNKFAVMEQALAKLNSMSGMLSSLFSN